MGLVGAFFGLGPGEYGLRTTGLPEGSTHNLFVDVWLESGILGVAGLLLLMGSTAVRGAYQYVRNQGPPEALFSVLGIAAIGALGLREYSLAYLYATSMGTTLVAASVALNHACSDN
jgi:O-antigen ligase